MTNWVAIPTERKIMRTPASLYFLHIPKTAGTSTVGLLQRFYQPDQWLPAYPIPELLATSLQTINSYKYFRGHFGLGLFSLLDQPPACITMLRDPFEQLVSLIQYSRRNLKEWDIPHLPPDYARIFSVLSGSDYLEQAVLDPVASPLFINLQARYLGCEIDLRSYLGNPSPFLSVETLTRQETDLNAIVKKAKQRLDSMAVVGIVERFDDSCSLICDFLGIQHQESYPKLNLAPDRQNNGYSTYRQSELISPRFADKIDELIHYDREVYEYGKSIFQRQLESLNHKSAHQSGPVKKAFSKLFSFFQQG